MNLTKRAGPQGVQAAFQLAREKAPRRRRSKRRLGSHARNLRIATAIALWLLVRYPVDVGAPEAHSSPLFEQELSPEPAAVRLAQLGRGWDQVLYVERGVGHINRFHVQVLAQATAIFGSPARLTGTNWAPGGEYDASFAHRSGCALDVELPRLGRTEVEQRTRALAAWMVEEVDYRSRVVVFMGHPLRTKTRGHTAHLPIAVRCHHEYDPRAAEWFGTRHEWAARLADSSWSWNGRP